MYTKRNFPINISIPKNEDFWCGLRFEEIIFERFLHFRIWTRSKASLSISIQSDYMGLFDLMTQSTSEEVFVEGRSFFKAISSTNIYKGFDLQIDSDNVKIITDKDTKKLPIIRELSLPKKTYPRPLLETHMIRSPEDFKNISCLAPVHKSCQDDALSHFMTKSHVTFDKSSISFWSTYGGIWHMVNIPFSQEDEYVSESDVSYSIRPYWFKNIPMLPEVNYVSIRMDSGNNPYLFLSNGQILDSFIIPLERDVCTVEFPEIPNQTQNKMPISRSIKLSERDRKTILKNIDVPNYFVLS